LNNLTHIRQFTYSLAEADQFLRLPVGKPEQRLIPELLLELPIRQWPSQIPKRLLDKARDLFAIHKLDFDMSLILSDRRVADRRHTLAHALDLRIIRCLIGI